MSDILLDQYKEYLDSFRAWGHEFLERSLTFDEFERLLVEAEGIELEEELGKITEEQRQRMEQIERQLLTHESYFVDGPRIWVSRGDNRT